MVDRQITLTPTLTADCRVVELRLQRIGGGVVLEEADDGRWTRRWTWLFAAPIVPADATTSTLQTMAATIEDCLADGCTVSQLIVVTGTQWPARMLVDDGLDGLSRACRGQGWTLWPQSIDPATPRSTSVWRATTGIDGSRFTFGRDRVVTRDRSGEFDRHGDMDALVGGEIVQSADPAAAIHRLESAPLAIGLHPGPAIRGELLALLHKWIPLSQVADTASERCLSGRISRTGNVKPDVESPHEFTPPQPVVVAGHGRARRLRIAAVDDEWQLSAVVDAEWVVVHGWWQVDTTSSEPEVPDLRRRFESTGSIGTRLRDALLAGVPLASILLFTGRAWPLCPYDGMLDSFADACVGRSWCWWPVAADDVAEPTDDGAVYRASVVDDLRYVIDSTEIVCFLGGVRAVEATMYCEATLHCHGERFTDLGGPRYQLAGMRCSDVGHRRALLELLRRRTLVDQAAGVTVCDEFTVVGMN